MNKNNRKKIFAISGSTRANSGNEAILKIIADRFKEELDVCIYKGIGTLPHFNPDVDDAHVSNEVREFRQMVQDAEGVIICTPEYVMSLPGALKNAIEWTVSTTVFSHKPLAIIVAAGSGEKAFEALSLVMTTIEARLPLSSRLLIKGARGKINAAGELIDKSVMADIDKVVRSLIESIDSPGGATKYEAGIN